VANLLLGGLPVEGLEVHKDLGCQDLGASSPSPSLL
jgi:hypothetical protein